MANKEFVKAYLIGLRPWRHYARFLKRLSDRQLAFGTVFMLNCKRDC